jgi:hypothetical protein
MVSPEFEESTVSRESTLPKPFVFVLMPLDDKLSDIYKFGIKGAAEDIGAYAERVDEQIFTEGILDRIFTQISKADVVVADMTGRNPNVFYEVGYAHALGKITLLLTQAVDDIPFDLKHRQHIVYGGKIDALRKELGDRLRWAIEESLRNRSPLRTERFALFVYGLEAVKPDAILEIPSFVAESPSRDFSIPLQLRNDSPELTTHIRHVYLLSKSKASLVPTEQKTWTSSVASYVTFPLATFGGADASPSHLEELSAGLLDRAADFDAQYRLPIWFPSMPPGAVEVAYLNLMFRAGEKQSDDHFRLRLFSSTGFHEFAFRLRIKLREDAGPEGGGKPST